MKKIITLLIITFALIATIIALFLIRQRYQIVIEPFPKFAVHPTPLSGVTETLSVPTPLSGVIVPTPLSGVTGTLSVPTPTTVQKHSINLPVPFTSQAPTGNWDKMHNENCEEASSIMAMAYYNDSYKNKTKLDASFVEEQMTKLTDWQLKNFGYNLDINSQETAEMIEKNYGLKTTILTDYSIEDIKKELAQNHLVLIPVNGQLIGNPNYKQPGPKYHMLVIRGYSGDSIITNDPGTRNGQNYTYDFKTLYNANGNWDHKKNTVNLKDKNIIIVWRQ